MLYTKLLSLTNIIFFLGFLQFSAAILVGVCNECLSTNNVACLDEYHFSPCFNGVPSATINKCPGSLVCTDHLQICRSVDQGYTPICYNDYCGDCDATNGVFTCLDETTYGYCAGGKIPYEGSVRSCPDGYVCNINSLICVPAATNQPSCITKTTTTTEISTITTDSTTDAITDSTTIESDTDPTTESSEVTPQTPTTTAAPREANVICGETAKKGFFKSDDPTCREYVYCYPLSGQFLGYFYYCDGYFNAETQKCQTERPLDCIEY